MTLPGFNCFKLQLIIEITPFYKSSDLLQSHTTYFLTPALDCILFFIALLLDIELFPLLWRIWMSSYD